MGNPAILFASVLLLAFAPAVHAAEAEHVDVDRAAELLAGNDDIVVLDVRTPGEFEAVHIAYVDAENIDIDAAAFRARLAGLDRDRTYLVHCAAGISGGRSARAVAIMEELGFTRVYHLDGGINAWKAAKQKVEGKAVEASEDHE